MKKPRQQRVYYRKAYTDNSTAELVESNIDEKPTLGE